MTRPGQIIGCLGGGQLGRMLGMEARRLGYGFRVYEPSSDCPAAAVADGWTRADYLDSDALSQFASSVDVVTYEFENIPVAALEPLARQVPVFPSPHILHLCQNREREKYFLRDAGFPHAPFAVVTTLDEARSALAALGCPAVLKTAEFGYDGKGQLRINNPKELPDAWIAFDGCRAVMEAWISYDLECSVVCARDQSGQIVSFPVVENIHAHHILDYSIVPARLSEERQGEAAGLAQKLAEALGLVGVIGVELFYSETDGFRVNELAPRTHNSGHYTLDACAVSQFEQQLRAVAGLPLGDAAVCGPVVMSNLLGDLWEHGEPRWEVLLSQPGARLYLYGKSQARPGRKMGHFTVPGDTPDAALELAQRLRAEMRVHGN